MYVDKRHDISKVVLLKETCEEQERFIETRPFSPKETKELPVLC